MKQSLTSSAPHHWLQKSNYLSLFYLNKFENFIIYINIRLVFKCLHNYVSPLFSALIKRRLSSCQMNTRASYNGDCMVPRCTASFGQSAFSVKGVNLWNTLPTHLKLETDTNAFNRGLKAWLKAKQQCSHV